MRDSIFSLIIDNFCALMKEIKTLEICRFGGMQQKYRRIQMRLSLQEGSGIAPY
jgi:hypothetical protein